MNGKKQRKKKALTSCTGASPPATFLWNEVCDRPYTGSNSTEIESLVADTELHIEVDLCTSKLI